VNTLRAARTCATIALLAGQQLTVAIALPCPADTVTTASVRHAEMQDWVADGEHGIWIQTRNLKWFYVRLMGRCHGLSSTNSLAFETGASGYIHRYSSVVLPGRGRCVVQALAPSAGPPQKRFADLVMQPQTQ
jgi:hypothetical protein